MLQELLAAGGRAVLVEGSLRLFHQEVGKEDTACFEGLCKTGKHFYYARNKYSVHLSFISKLQQQKNKVTTAIKSRLLGKGSDRG